MIKENQKKETKLLEHRFIELSRIAFEREIVTYSDFLNLNDQNILHTLPKDKLYSRYVLFGGYDMAERQMAAFIPEALSLRYGVSDITPKEIDYPFCAVKIEPKNKRFSEDLTHRDFLGSILNLGIDRSKTGDILVTEDSALLFINKDLVSVVTEDLTRVRHTVIDSSVINLDRINYTPDFQQIKGTVSSVRLDSLLPLAFSSSRSKLSGLIEGAKVFVNGVEADAEVKEKDGLLAIAVADVKPQDTVTICLPEDTEIAKNDVMTRAMDLLLHAEISYITKEQIANLLRKADGKVAILAAELQSMELSNDLRGALLEIITA